MRGTRVKRLRQTFRETYGFDPPKARRFIRTEKPRGIWQKFWWWITKRQARSWVEISPSIWRRWKKLAKATDRAS